MYCVTGPKKLGPQYLIAGYFITPESIIVWFLAPLVLWHRCLGDRKVIRPVKTMQVKKILWSMA